MKIQPGTLYVVGTPIGNLEDITARALQVLSEVDWIAAEDTRHTAKLLNHFSIATPQISYHTHNRLGRLPDLLARLQRDKAIALVSDAGMPGISDPGYELVQACIAAEVPVVPIPGVTAVTTAVSVAGLPSDRFVFEGFLPTKGKERKARLRQLQTETRTIVLYEAPHRLRGTLTDLASTLGDDRAIVCGRELTKRYEELWRGSLSAAIDYFTTQSPQGEFTLVIAGADPMPVEWSEEDIRAELTRLLQDGVSRSQASRQVAQQSQRSRQSIYQISLSIDL